MEQKPLPGEGCFAWHPLRHAAMVAVEKAAERDRTRFPSSTSITKPGSNCNLENYNEPAKRLKADTKVSLIACWHKILIAITYLLFYETSNDAYSFLYFFFSDSSNLNIRIKSNQQMNHAMATCPKQADHICAQDLISTLFGNHAQCKFNLHLTLTSFSPSYCLCCLPVTLFEGVRWHLYIIDSSVCSTLSLIQLMEHSVESTGCMGRKVLIITTTYLGFQYLTHT